MTKITSVRRSRRLLDGVRHEVPELGVWREANSRLRSIRSRRDIKLHSIHISEGLYSVVVIIIVGLHSQRIEQLLLFDLVLTLSTHYLLKVLFSLEEVRRSLFVKPLEGGLQSLNWDGAEFLI
jgi:hypothetical protein